MSKSLEELGHALITAARAAGAEAADAVLVDGSSLSIDVRAGALEHAERSEGVDIGLRVLLGHKQAFVSASDTSADTIAQMAERAVAMAREAPDDPYAGLADPDMLARDWDVSALELSDPGADPAPGTLEQDALRAEAAALAVEGVSQVQTASAYHGRQRVQMVASNGFAGGYARSTHAVSCVAIAGTGLGMERDYDGDARTFQSDMRSPEDIGTRAAERAVERIGARRPATGSYPVLFDERISSSLIGHLLSASNGAAVARGASWLKDDVGAQILPAALSVVEDPHRPRMSSSRPFDGEGLATRTRAIIDKGVLTGWTLDLASARKLGLTPTGNAARGVGSPPSPTTWNIELTQGAQSRDDLIRDMGTGLLVTSMIGSTINPNTGDYSRGAAGFWVENGALAYPVNEITIAGNLRDMLARMIPANDARAHMSTVVPSLLIEGMTLAGS